MKRWMRWMLAGGIVCCLAGAGTITAGAMMGGHYGVMKILEREHVWERFESGWDHRTVRPEKVMQPGLEEIPVEAGTLDDVEWPDGEIFSGDTEFSLEDGSLYMYENVRKLDLEISGNHVKLQEKEELEAGQVWVFCEGDQERIYRIDQKGEELQVRVNELHHMHPGAAENIVIYVPAAYVFAKVEVENDGGSFQAERIYADDLSLENNAGKVSVYGGSVRALDVECNAGTSNCRAVVSEHASVECNAGEATVTLAGEEELYDYSLECNLGSITINGKDTKHYQGVDVEKHLDNRTGRKVDLECDMGTITVDFQEPVV